MRHPIRLSACLTASFAFAAFSVQAEAAAAKPAPIGVTVSDVSETRMSGSLIGECRLTLSLSGDAVADAQEVRRVRVTNARDELGRDLIKPVDPAAGMIEAGVTPVVSPVVSSVDEQRRFELVAGEVARRRAMRDGQAVVGAPAPAPSPAVRNVMKSRPSISLRNPSRQSATIKIIEGEIDLFAPTEANGGIVRLTEPFAKPATLIANDALKASAIQLMYLPIETYAKDREATGRDARDAAGPWSEEVATMMKGFASLPTDRRGQTLIFFLHDPNRVVVDLELQTKDGKRLDRGTLRIGAPQLRGITLDAPPPADAQLVLRVAAPGAITAHPFKLENIPLP